MCIKDIFGEPVDYRDYAVDRRNSAALAVRHELEEQGASRAQVIMALHAAFPLEAVEYALTGGYPGHLFNEAQAELRFGESWIDFAIREAGMDLKPMPRWAVVLISEGPSRSPELFPQYHAARDYAKSMNDDIIQTLYDWDREQWELDDTAPEWTIFPLEEAIRERHVEESDLFA